MSEANMLAAAESMAKAKLHAKAHSKSEQSLFTHIKTKDEIEKDQALQQGPPVVSAIQAIDQYGHVIASATNPKAYQFQML